MPLLTITDHNAALAATALPAADDKVLARADVLCPTCGVELVRPRHKPVVVAAILRVGVRCICCGYTGEKLVSGVEVAAIVAADAAAIAG